MHQILHFFSLRLCLIAICVRKFGLKVKIRWENTYVAVASIRFEQWIIIANCIWYSHRKFNSSNHWILLLQQTCGIIDGLLVQVFNFSTTASAVLAWGQLVNLNENCYCIPWGIVTFLSQAIHQNWFVDIRGMLFLLILSFQFLLVVEFWELGQLQAKF